MLKLKGYLKPFITGIILTIILLFVQALADLNLPNYMSDIVNVGIQQNGIEHAAPEAISSQGLEFVQVFLTETEQERVVNSYSLVSGSDQAATGTTYQNLYPKADSQFYIKKTLDEAELNKLDRLFGVATNSMIQVLTESRLPAGTPGASEGPTNMADVKISQLYQLQPLFDQLPEEVLTAAHQKASLNDDRMLQQSGILLTKGLYQELGANIQKMQNNYILRIGFIMILFALLGGIATILVSLLSSRIATGVARNLRKDVFNKIESFSNKEFDQFGAASLITRSTNDITQMQQFLQIGIRMMAYAPIIGVGGVIMAIEKSPSMSWILGVAVVIIFGMIMIILAIAMPRFKIMQKLVDRLNLVSRESLSGLMVIRAFGTQDYEKKRFEAANAELTSTNLFVNRMVSVMMPVMMLIMNGLTLLIIWVGATKISESSMQVGDMMAYMQYAMQVLMAFMMLSMMFIFVPRAAVSALRIAEVLQTELSIADPAAPKDFNPDLAGVLEFKSVHFRYAGAEEDALCDINFKAKPGQTTAIIGSTGSGKSTIASLALRFYDVSSGQILLDGVDVREVNQEALRNKIGYVPQKGVLLSGSIAFNLKYGKPDASDQEMEAAAAVAQATDFIAERPEGFQADIAQGGKNVSGGQKQRLSIARALAKQPEVLIFDDSFSALDFKTDVMLRKALKEQVGDSTVIIIAQRISSIRHAEQIIVLDKGRIVGKGTHEELLKNCTAYYEIALSQLGEGEIA